MLLVESRVEAEHRNELFVLDCWLGHGPVEDGVVMQAQVISHPEDNSVHLGLVEI